MRVLASGVLAVALLGSACLPVRDNPNDPSLAPDAALRVVANCGDEQGTSALELGRSNCLTLDAEATSDPQNPATDRHRGLRFEYRLLSGCDTVPALLATNGGAFFPLPPSVTLGCPVELPLKFQVDVYDAGGAHGSATASVQLRNGAPTAAISPPRSLPLGGYPWALGTPFDVTFDVSGSEDPDGDPTWFCLRIVSSIAPAESFCTDDPADPQLTRPLSVERQRLTVTLVVHDNDPQLPISSRHRTSAPVTTTLSISEPNVWTTRGGQGGYYELLDRGADELPDPFDDRLRAATLVETNDVAFAYQSSGGEVYLASATLPGFDGALQHSRIGNVNRLATAPDGSLVWSVGTSLDSGTACDASAAFTHTTVRAFDPTNGYAQVVCVPEATAFLGYTPFGYSVVTDDAGNVWAGFPFFDTLVAVTPSGTTTLYESPGRILSGLSARPSTGEVWALFVPDFFSGSTELTSELARFTDPSSPPEIVEFGSQDFGLAFIDSQYYWIGTSDGLELRDATLLEAGVAPDATTTLAFPDIRDTLVLVADPINGTVWTLDSTGTQSARVELTGDVFETVISDDEALDLIMADRTGNLWHRNTTDRVRRSHSVALTGLLQQVPIFATSTAAYDLRDGGLWMSGILPTRIARVAVDGSVLESFPTVMQDGVESTVPIFYDLTMSPGRNTGWAMRSSLFTNDFVLSHLDFGVVPPAVETVLGGVETEAIVDADALLEPLATLDPLSPEDRAFVSVLDAVDSARIALVDPTGTLTTVFSLPADEIGFQMQIRGALSQSSNRLCMVTRDQVAQELRVRWLSPDGTIEDLGSIPNPTRNELSVAVSETDRDGNAVPACWVASNSASGAEVYAWSSPGAPLRMHIEPGEEVTSIVASTLDEIWLAVDREDPITNEIRTTHLGLRTQSGPDFTRRIELLPSGSSPDVMIGPATSGQPDSSFN